MKSFLISAGALFLAGCSFVNFSGNYYDLPPDAYSQVHVLWKGLMRDLPRKHSYRYVILPDSEFKKSKGIPAIAEDTVIVPEKFLKYIYQNYYDHREVILESVIVHEICHKEYALPSKPAREHFEADRRAIELLKNIKISPGDYYRSLGVMKNYWFARKGVAGHAFNASWNAVNAASLALIGHGWFADWFATDLEERMGMIAKNYKIRVNFSLSTFSKSS